MQDLVEAKFSIGEIVKHRFLAFRGDYRYRSRINNSEEWYLSIPENIRPRKEQPFYHLLAEDLEKKYVTLPTYQNKTF